jgi:hypothetical protein
MNRWWIRFGLLLDADPRDVGCDAAQAVVHVYVDELRAGIDAPSRNPGAAEHFVNCQTCGQILQGLVAALLAHGVACRDP